MLWGLSDRFVDEVIAVYRTRDEAVGAHEDDAARTSRSGRG